MQADREEWLEQQKLNNKDEVRHNGANSAHITNMLQQASVKLTTLTNDENWNYYLTLLQSWIEKTRISAEHFRKALESPDLVDRSDRKKYQNYLMICNERMTVLNAVIGLPKQIIEDQKNAELHIPDLLEAKHGS